MGPLDILNHLLNFVAPAAFVALLLVLGGRLLGAKGAAVAIWRQWAVVFVVGLVVLAAGLAQIGASEPTKRIITGAVIVIAVVLDTYRSRRAGRRN